MLNEIEQRIIKGGYNRLVNCCENILSRPNDNIKLMGEEKYNNFVKATEKILNNYKHDELYKYYYELPKRKHGFCTFDRWKQGLLF